MLAAAGSIFGLFLLSSLYLQNVLGMGPLSTGLAFIPLALAAGVGAHAAGHITSKHGVRGPLAAAFLIAAAGMTLLAHVGENGSYVTDVLPGHARRRISGSASPSSPSRSPSSPAPAKRRPG